MIPERLLNALEPVTVVVGHYGAGKTNFSVNLAIDLSDAGSRVTLIDLDVVNPYFRATEQRALLEEHGVRLVAPVFSEAATSLDVPSLTGQITPAIQDARTGSYVIIDAGGDDVGSTALGRFARAIASHDYAMLYIANRNRNLVADPADALVNLREIEYASHLFVSAIVSNAHLKAETTIDTVKEGIAYAEELGNLAALPVVCATVPPSIETGEIADTYCVLPHVKNPWE